MIKKYVLSMMVCLIFTQSFGHMFSFPDSNIRRDKIPVYHAHTIRETCLLIAPKDTSRCILKIPQQTLSKILVIGDKYVFVVYKNSTGQRKLGWMLKFDVVIITTYI